MSYFIYQPTMIKYVSFFFHFSTFTIPHNIFTYKHYVFGIFLNRLLYMTLKNMNFL